MLKKLLPKLGWVLFFATICAIGYLAFQGKIVWQASPSVKDTLASVDREEKKAPEQNEQIPAYVFEVLDYVRENGKAMEGYVGGRVFANREKKLPSKGSKGEKITYREWDVHPKIKGENRGPERLVTSGKKSAYYTRDHYKTFIEIKE